MDISDEEHEIFEERDDEEQNEAIETNDNEENENGENKEPVKVKRIIRNPRVTLNAERLKGPKGLGALEGCFKEVKFKGKGHEEQDLNVLLKTYEYWCHRLFPKFPFKETIERIEKLGTKGPIQTHLKKIRSGLADEELPTNSETVQDSDEDNRDENTQINQAIIDDIPVELTEEQLETIRKNREKAEFLRQERLRRIQEKANDIIRDARDETGTDNGVDDGKGNDGLVIENILDMCEGAKEDEEPMEII